MAQLLAVVRCALAVSVLITVTATGLCAQTDRAVMKPDVSGAAQLIAFQGQISVLRDNTLWALNNGDYVQPLQVIVTGPDGSGMFKVADGSTFEVFPKSKVVFRANSGNWRDLLEIWLGKVRIEIQHPGGVPNNNKVRTPTAVISVRGTIFDVEYDPDDGATLVVDEEGTIEVARALRLNDTRILNPGEQIRVYKNDTLGRAMIDKGGALKKVYQAAMDALTQQIINGRTNTPTGGATGPAGGTTIPSGPATTPSGGAGDNNKNTPPPAPPPAPPAPPAP